MAGAVSIKQGDLDDSEDSAADTTDAEAEAGGAGSESDDDTHAGFEAVLAKHPGDPEGFQAHMRGFIVDLLDVVTVPTEPVGATETFDVPVAGRSQEWSYCMLVWMRFAEEASLDASSRQKWLECVKSPTQGKMLTLLDTILKAPGTVHPLWSRDDFKRLNCNKDFAAALYVTDRMVQR